MICFSARFANIYLESKRNVKQIISIEGKIKFYFNVSLPEQAHTTLNPYKASWNCPGNANLFSERNWNQTSFPFKALAVSLMTSQWLR